jgi:hypothetical protein
MRKLLALVLVGLAVLTGCGQDESVPQTPTTVPAGSTVELGTSSAFLTLVQACGASAVVWTYSGTSVIGYAPAIDGQVTQTGVFTSPVCGSNLLGTTVTITAVCDGKTPVSANIAVGQELVNSISIIAADVRVCGGTVCRALNPQAITIPACPVTSPTTIQFYSRIDTSCGTGAAYSPSEPPTGIPACTF